MSRRLIVNADDLGFNREITDGILDAHQNGVVTSTTLMINMPAAEYAVTRAKEFPQLSVGLHVNLTAGRPLCEPGEVSTLVDRDGMFLDAVTFFRKGNRCQLDPAHLEKEMRSQLQRIHDLGLVPSHADSHHHAASCVQPFPIKLKLLKEFGVPKIRSHRGWYRADRTSSRRWATWKNTFRKNLRRAPFRVYYELQHLFCKLRKVKTPTERYGFGKVVSDRPLEFNMESVDSFLATMPRGVNELCCHPGYLSEDPLDEPEFRVLRPQELAFFTNPDLRTAIEAAGVQLISYRDF